MSDTSLVWHYTDARGILGIIEKRRLWATHARFMNDRLEGSVMHRALRDYIDSETKLTSTQLDMVKQQYSFLTDNIYPTHTRVSPGNIFIVSASGDNDALTLWRNYARESVSFAVGFDPDVPLGVIPRKKSFAERITDITQWSNVNYVQSHKGLPKNYRDKIRAAARHEDQSDQIVEVARELQHTLSRAKHVAFRDEREIRIAFFEDQTQNWHFRAGRYGVTPYIEVGTAESWGRSSDGSEVLPIRAIRVSANATEADMLALNALLESNGFTFGEVYGEVEDEEGVTQQARTDYIEPIEITQSQNPLRP